MFYLDWTFWTVVVSVLAVVLSQLPPVHLLLRSAKLDLELYSRILISHFVGNPNIQIHLILNNVGGKTVKILQANLRLTREGKDISSLPAQNYLQHPADKTTVLFTRFYLKPGEEW